MKKIPLAIILILSGIAAASFPASGRGRVSVGFYNVENLFDTVPNPLAGDAEFTPKGTNRWDTGRYRAKIANVARVLDDMSADIAGLAEVENEAVLRDLVCALKTDYAYIHLTDNDPRGIEQALLYKGDVFFPGKPRIVPSAAGRGFLYVKGLLAGHRVDIVVVHMPSMLNDAGVRERAFRSLLSFVDSLCAADPAARPVIMGDMNAAPSDPVMLRTMGGSSAPLWQPFSAEAKKGAGTYARDGRRLLFDQIIIPASFQDGDGLRYSSCGIFVRDYMLSGQTGHPLRTFSQGRYTGGFSDHLPVRVYFSFEKLP